MDKSTIIIFILLYIWGFSLTIWAIFFDKHPTKKTVNASKFALGVLIASLFYFFYKISL